MKKKTFLIALLAAGILCSCGDNSEDSSGTETQDNFSSASAQSVQEDSTSEEIKEDPSHSDEESVYNLKGIHLPILSGMEEANVFAKCVWVNSDKSVIYDIDHVPDYGLIADPDSYDLEDTPDIMWPFIIEVIDEFVPAGTKSTYSALEQEKVSMLGYDVIRMTGTIQTSKYDETHDLNFAAYYGLFDLQDGDYQKIPTVMIAFSETEPISELEKVVDYSYNNAAYKE